MSQESGSLVKAAADPLTTSKAEVTLGLPSGQQCARENFEGRKEMLQRWDVAGRRGENASGFSPTTSSSWAF